MIDSNYHNDTTVVLEQIDELEPKYVKGGPEPNEHIPVPSPPSSVLTHLENNEFPLGKGVFIDFTFLLVIISEVIIGIIFVIRRKRK